LIDRNRVIVRNLLDAGAVVAALVFIAGYFPASVMLTETTTNGGDMGSHYYPAAFLREVLLPRGQITGWCPGNYCGFPLFQFYFPLPFVLMAALSYVIPLPIAFKLVSQLGTFLLPVCAYLALRLARVPFPGPALGALSSLCFLFMEANSMWGGNIPSTLAGEFAFGLGLALAILFVGALRRAIDTGRGYAWTGLLVALIGLAHGYTLLWTGFTSLAELVAVRGWWRRFWALVAVHGLAILLMGFWLLPLLGYAAWTTAYSHVWFIKNWQEILPPILWPAAILAVLTLMLVGVMAYLRREPFPRGLAAVWAGTLVGVLFYLTASVFHVVDIRFFPFMQLGFCLAAAAGIGYLVSRLPVPEMWPVVGALAILPFVQQQTSFIPSWITWNYSGFEKKAPWKTFHAINEHLRGDFRDPRVVYEHNPDHEALGTVRAFENLPLFSGRSTLEGLYMQAVRTSPFVFYTQSEVSHFNSCPFTNYGCSRLDLDRGVDHLRMFNVSQYVIKGSQVKAAAEKHPGLEREAVFGQYEVWRVKENDGRYAIPLAVAPALVVTPDWKDTAYRWFKRARPEDPVPVFVDAASAEERAAFSLVYDGLPPEIPRQPLGPPPPLVEQMETERITVSGCTPGHPVLIRISYHPRWKALGGERVWLAAPSFMLVFPKSERLELVYGSGPPVTIGQLFTLVGLILFALSVLPIRRRVMPALQGLLEIPPIPAAVRVARQTGEWSPRVRGAVLGAVLVATAAFVGAAAFAARTADADGVYRKGLKVYEAGRLRDAVPLFREARRLAPMSNTAIHSSYFESISLFRENEWAEAEKSFRRLIETFPEAQAAAESQYHIGVCRARLGDVPGAVEAWKLARERYPGTPWSNYAGERLAEVEKATGG
jgi:hypothetical protein